MTRKHFQAIADGIAGEYAVITRLLNDEVTTKDSAKLYRVELATIQRTAEAVASQLAQFNPNFDRAKFLTRALPERVTV